jgi:hypothetical protein
MGKNVLSGEIGHHQSEISSIVGDEKLDMLFQYAASLKKCRLTAEEATIVRGIVLTSTGKRSNNFNMLTFHL